MKRQHSNLYRAFLAGISAIYFFTNVAAVHASESTFWAERRRASFQKVRGEEELSIGKISTNPNSQMLLAQLPHASPMEMGRSFPPRNAVGPNDKKEPFSVGPKAGDWLGKLVMPYGAVNDLYLSPKPDAPFIVHIQDAHGIEEAQRNIAAMIGLLTQEPGIRLVGLEGAAGPFSLDPYRDFPTPAMTKDVAEFFLKKGLIAGPEYAGLTLPQSPIFFGAENNDLYMANVQALKMGYLGKEGAQATFNALQREIEKLKETLYTKSLKIFDKHIEAYHADKEKLADYVRYLVANVPSMSDRPSVPNLHLLVKALDEEYALDFKRVETERKQLVERLVEKLTKPNLQDLVDKSVDYRAGRMGYGDYHTHLRKICLDHKISLSDFPQLARYISYVLLADEIDRKGLLNEMDSLERALPASLAKSSEEKKLVSLAHDLVLLNKLLRHEMTTIDWTAYQTRRENIYRFGARLAELNPTQAISTAFTKETLKPFEDFCSYAVQRNTALTDNFSRQMTQGKTKSGILVAGGFHTEGLSALLRQRQISYVVVTPKITNVPADNTYLDILAKDPVPLEQLLAGDRIYLSQRIALGWDSQVAQAVRAWAALLRGKAGDYVEVFEGYAFTTAKPNPAHIIRELTIGGFTIYFVKNYRSGSTLRKWAVSLFKNGQSFLNNAPSWLAHHHEWEAIAGTSISIGLYTLGAPFLVWAFVVGGLVFLHYFWNGQRAYALYLKTVLANEKTRLTRPAWTQIYLGSGLVFVSLLLTAYGFPILINELLELHAPVTHLVLATILSSVLTYISLHKPGDTFAKRKGYFQARLFELDSSFEDRLTDFYREGEGFDWSLYVSLIRHLAEDPEIQSNSYKRILMAFKEGGESQMAAVMKEIAQNRADQVGYTWEPEPVDEIPIKQAGFLYQSVVEWANNGFDAMTHPLGRHGMGALQGLAVADSPGDFVEFKSRTNADTGFEWIVSFQRNKDRQFRLRFARAQRWGDSGTTVHARRAKTFKEKSLSEVLYKRMGYCRRGTVRFNDKPINQMKGMIGNKGPRISSRDSGVVEISLYRDKDLMVTDPGQGISPETMLFVLPVPEISSHRNNAQLAEAWSHGDATANGQNLIWNPKRSTEMTMILQVGGTEVETFQLRGPELPTTIAIDLPIASYQDPAREKVMLGPVERGALRALVDEWVALYKEDPMTRAPLMNGLFRLLDFIESQSGRGTETRIDDELRHYFVRKMSALQVELEAMGFVFLPALADRAWVPNHLDKNKQVFLNTELFIFDPAKSLGAERLDGTGKLLWSVSGLGQMDVRVGKDILLLNREELHRHQAQAIPGHSPVLLTTLLSLWKGYGGRPSPEATLVVDPQNDGVEPKHEGSTNDFSVRLKKLLDGIPEKYKLLLEPWIRSSRDFQLGINEEALAHQLRRAVWVLDIMGESAPLFKDLFWRKIGIANQSPKYMQWKGGVLIPLEDGIYFVNLKKGLKEKMVGWSGKNAQAPVVIDEIRDEDDESHLIAKGNRGWVFTANGEIISFSQSGVREFEKKIFHAKGAYYVFGHLNTDTQNWRIYRLSLDGSLSDMGNLESAKYDLSWQVYPGNGLLFFRSKNPDGSMKIMELSDDGLSLIPAKGLPQTGMEYPITPHLSRHAEWTIDIIVVDSKVTVFGRNSTNGFTTLFSEDSKKWNDDLESDKDIGWRLHDNENAIVLFPFDSPDKPQILSGEGVGNKNSKVFRLGNSFYVYTGEKKLLSGSSKGNNVSLTPMGGFPPGQLAGAPQLLKGNLLVNWKNSDNSHTLFRIGPDGQRLPLLSDVNEGRFPFTANALSSGIPNIYCSIDTVYELVGNPPTPQLFAVFPNGLKPSSNEKIEIYGRFIQPNYEGPLYLAGKEAPVQILDQGYSGLAISFYGGRRLLFRKQSDVIVDPDGQLSIPQERLYGFFAPDGYFVEDRPGGVGISPLDPLSKVQSTLPGHLTSDHLAQLSLSEAQKTLLIENLLSADLPDDDLRIFAPVLPFLPWEALKRLNEEGKRALQSAIEGKTADDLSVMGDFLTRWAEIEGDPGRYSQVSIQWLQMHSMDPELSKRVGLSLEDPAESDGNGMNGWDMLSSKSDLSNSLPNRSPIQSYLRGELVLPILPPSASDRSAHLPILESLENFPLSALSGFRANTGLLARRSSSSTTTPLSLHDVKTELKEYFSRGYQQTEQRIDRASQGPFWAWVMDGAQNAIKACDRANVPREVVGDVHVARAGNDLEIQYSIQDPGIGMNLEDILSDLLPLGRGHRELTDDPSLGDNGRGWYKYLKGDRAELITGKKGEDSHWRLVLEKRNGRWWVAIIEHRAGIFNGTRVTTMERIKNTKRMAWNQFQFSQTNLVALKATLFADKLQTSVGCVSGVKIVFMGKEISETPETIASVEWAPNEFVEVIKTRSHESRLLHAGFKVKNLLAEPDVLALLPPGWVDLFQREGYSINLPSSPKDQNHAHTIDVNMERSGLREKDKYIERLQQAIYAVEARVNARRIAEGKPTDVDIPLDFLYRSEHVMPTMKGPEGIADLINSNQWDEIPTAQAQLVSADSRQTTRVVAHVEVPRDKQEPLSLVRLREKIIALSPGDSWEHVYEYAKGSPGYERLTREAEIEMGRTPLNSSEPEKEDVDIDEDLRDLSVDDLQAREDLKAIISAFMTPLMRALGYNPNTKQPYQVRFVTNKYSRIATFTKGSISLNTKPSRNGAYAFLEWMKRHRKGESSADEDYSMLVLLFETLFHENTHAWEGSESESHDDLFLEEMRKQLQTWFETREEPPETLFREIMTKAVLPPTDNTTALPLTHDDFQDAFNYEIRVKRFLSDMSEDTHFTQIKPFFSEINFDWEAFSKEVMHGAMEGNGTIVLSSLNSLDQALFSVSNLLAGSDATAVGDHLTALRERLSVLRVVILKNLTSEVPALTTSEASVACF